MTDRLLPTSGTRGGPPEDFYDVENSDNVCFVCQNPDYHLKYKVTHYGFPFEFKQCQCGMIKQTPMPNEAFFEWFFNSDLFISAKASKKKEIWGFYDYFKDEASRMATSRRRYRKLERYFGSGSLNIMKIGPSTGTFLHVANQHGHRTIGCDVSERFAGYARDQYGVRIDHGRFEDMGYADGQFDVILLFNVLENVPNQDEFLAAVHRTVKPGGLFILNYVNEERNVISALQKEKYFIYRPPICYVYTRPVLERVLGDRGFEIVADHPDIRYMNIVKVATLLGWHWIVRVAGSLRIHQRPFPVFAYPSRVLIARRT